MAATLWLGRGSAISHATAGSWLHLDGIRTDELHVTRARDQPPRVEQRRSHHSSRRFASAARRQDHRWSLVHERRADTVRCCGRSSTMKRWKPRWSLHVDSASRPSTRRSVCSESSVRDQARLRSVPFSRCSSGGPWSPELEIKLARLLERARFRHRSPSFGSVRIAFDRAWPERRVAIEADGFQHHGRRLDWKRDRRRIAAIEADALANRARDLGRRHSSSRHRPWIESRSHSVSWRRDRAAVRRVRRRQSLLRSARRVHASRAAGDAAAVRAMVRDQRTEVSRRRRPGEPRRREPDVRSRRQSRRDARLLPRQPRGQAADGVPARARADSRRIPQSRRVDREARRVRPRGDLAVPDAWACCTRNC